MTATGFFSNRSTADAICNAIDVLSGKVKNSLKRGIKKHICSKHKYICVGTYPPRGSTGIVKQHYTLDQVHQKFRTRIQKYVSGVEHCYREYGDQIELKMLREASALIGPSLFSVSKDSAQRKRKKIVLSTEFQKFMEHLLLV